MSALVIILLLFVLVVGGVIAYAVWPSKKKGPTPSPTPPTPPRPAPDGGNGNNGGGGGNGGCAWEQYLAQDNNDVPACKQEGCKLKGTTVEQCKAACCDKPLCAAAQWRDDGRCLLKDTVGTIRKASKDKTLYVKQVAE